MVNEFKDYLGLLNEFQSSQAWATCGSNSYRLIYFNVRSPAGGTVLGRIRRSGLVVKVCHWVWVLRFQKPTSGTVSLSLPPTYK